MRLTTVLLKESYRWKLKMLWQRKGMNYPLTTKMPTYVQDCVDKGLLKIHTPDDILKPEVTFPYWEPPVKDDPQLKQEKTEKDHVNYHGEWIYEFSPSVQLIEGEKQALILTKSQPFYELPASVRSLIGKTGLKDQDTLMQRVIMQSNIWDPTKVKLPRRKCSPDLARWKFKAEVGIPNARISSTMVKGISHLCEMALYKTIQLRKTIVEPTLYSFYYHNDKHIAISADYEMLLCSSKPVAPFADETLVDASTTHALPDIYPLAPTIDLKKQHIWKVANVPGWKTGYSHPHAHTLFVTYDDEWTTSQRNAKALMYCFGQALSLAKLRYGSDVAVLPEPIAVQCVLTNGIEFSLTCFQLNTVDVSKAKGGLKNLVWFDSDNAMYLKKVPKRSMLRNAEYEKYDPSVLQKLLAMYANGHL